MAFDASSIGCSIRCVDDKLGTSGICSARASCRVRGVRSSSGLQLELDEVDRDWTRQRDAVRAMLAGTAVPRPQELRPGPRFAGRRWRSRRSCAHASLILSPCRNWIRSVAKDELSERQAVCVRGLRISRLMSPRVTMLLYDRLSDEVRDNLTVGIERIRAGKSSGCAARCDVVSIEDHREDRTPCRGSTDPLVATHL